MATIANLVVNVMADTADIKRGVSETNAVLGGMETTVRSLATSLAATFSFQQVAAAAEKVTDMASRINDLAVKAGISAEAVQELDFAAKLSGSSFEQISGALIQ